MKKFTTLTMLLLCSLMLSAQSIDVNWWHKYDSLDSEIQIATLPDGNYMAAYGNRYFKINSSGDSLDYRRVGNDFVVTSAIMGMKDSIIIGGRFNGNGAIAKMDKNFNVAWSNEFI